MVNTIRHEDITGASLTGSDGDANRTYSLDNTPAIIGGFNIIISNAALQYSVDYTLSNSVLTFINRVWDNQNITLNYFTLGGTDSVSNTYTTTLKVAETVGLSILVVNENVGTGTSSATSFDLDNGQVLASSYTLKYSSGTSDNSFTELTETTHYVMSKDGGTIELTSAGVTALSTNVLFADYSYSKDISDSELAYIISLAEAEVDKLTGNYWGTGSDDYELFDGQANFQYPTTDYPYANDWDEPDRFVLSKKGILNVTRVSVLATNVGLGSVQSYDSTLSSYANNTSEANSFEGTSFKPFGSTTANGDYLYVGSIYKFLGLTINLFTEGVTTGTNTIEYWNGSAWTALTPTESVTGVLDIESSGKLSWDSLDSWSKTSVNDSDSLYFIRVVANTTYSTEAKIDNVYMDQDSVFSYNVPLFKVRIDGSEIIVNDYRFPRGRNNVRIDYSHGYSSVPTSVEELTSVVAGIVVFVRITGGSFDTPSVYTLPEGSVSVGQVYVNVREAVNQLEARKNSLLDSVGRKMDIFVS